MPWIGLDIDGSEILLLGDYPYISDNGKWGHQKKEYMAFRGKDGKERKGVKLTPGTIFSLSGKQPTKQLVEISKEESLKYANRQRLFND